jgi:phage shock protein PspC (stress-responsive transcriptional regulator)
LDRKIAGVCSGFADYIDADPVIVRLIWVMITIGIFPVGLLGYIIAWIVVPNEEIPPAVFMHAGVPQT